MSEALAPPPSSPDELLLARRSARPASRPAGLRTHSALERCEQLCDVGSFTRVGSMRRGGAAAYGGKVVEADGDGVVAGFGEIDGRPIVVVAHDFSVAGGSIGAGFAAVVVRAQEIAIDRGCPVVYLNDSAGARIHEGIDSLHGCGQIFFNNVKLQKIAPQISVILGPCAGAAAYSPALTDWTIMVRGQSQMFLTGPAVVEAATGEIVAPEDLGGADLHTRRSGVAHIAVDDEGEALALTRRILSFLPTARGEAPPRIEVEHPDPVDADRLATVVPSSTRAPFDMRKLLAGIVDASPQVEFLPRYAPSVLIGLARLDGRAIGIVASQPKRKGAILDAASAQKISRFVRFCGRFGLPICTFVDVPGFLPGSAEERRAVITHGAEMLAAYSDASVPKLTVIVRKAYGGAYIAMGSASLGADFSWAWPTAELAVMGPEGAVGLLHRRELAAADDPAALRERLSAAYRSEVTHPYLAAEAGMIDEVILPDETRGHLIRALRLHDREPRPAAGGVDR